MMAGDKFTSKGHSGKSQFTDAEDGSELISSLKLKNKQKITSRGEHGVRSKHLSRKMAENLSGNNGRQRKLKTSNNNSAVSEGNESNASDNPHIKKRRRRRKKKKRRKDLGEPDEASRLQRRTRYLLIRMKTEQNLIDAYSGEGWKGQSREKIKPVRELQRAKKQILNCKLGIRDAIKQLDSLGSVGRFEESVIAPDGSIYHEHIFCAKCLQGETSPDNDIILCDGACNRGFHQKCLVPPLDTEDIPPEDQGWFCKICDLKMEILELVNVHLGTCFSAGSNWQEVFKDEAALSDAGIEVLDQDDMWPSDDSADGDYRAGTSNSSQDTNTSTSLSWSLDHEVVSESQNLEQEEVGYPYSCDELTDADVLFGRRQRSAVDYKQLYSEMFGKDAAAPEQVSEDEDWGPTKRRRREKESDAADTLMTLHESETTCLRSEAEENGVLHEPTQGKRTLCRIPLDAVEKLRQAFAENELPSRSVRENLSQELGLHPEKVSKWFKNARYMALKIRKAGRAVKDPSSPETCKEHAVESTGEKIPDPVQSKDTLPNCATISPDITLATSEMEKKLPSGSKMKMKKHGEGSFRSLVNNNGDQVEAEHDADIHLEKQPTPLNSKPGNDSTGAEFVSADQLQGQEIELECLCRLKNRLENLKERLVRYRPIKSKARGRPKLQKEPFIMYVPTAVVVREKKA